jgi:hypothetical protein
MKAYGVGFGREPEKLQGEDARAIVALATTRGYGAAAMDCGLAMQTLTGSWLWADYVPVVNGVPLVPAWVWEELNEKAVTA